MNFCIECSNMSEKWFLINGIKKKGEENQGFFAYSKLE